MTPSGSTRSLQTDAREATGCAGKPGEPSGGLASDAAGPRVLMVGAAESAPHLHFDHCGGNRLFPGIPIRVQRREREAACEPGYTIPEWVEFPGARYVELEGEEEIVPGVRVLPTPGHTPGHQSVLVDTDDGLVVVAGDVAYRWEDFDAAAGRLLGLGARRLWLAHETAPRDR